MPKEDPVGNPTTKDLKHNYLVNVLDGGFFGFALGFASFSTILPLFVATMTDSATLIGLIPAIHNMGWQLPQLLTARQISRLERFKPMVMTMTILERLPFLGFAAIAWFMPTLGKQAGLAIAFVLLICQGLGAGLTANAWQNMIGKIIPSDYRATFFGLQSAAANLLASIGAIVAGYLLERTDSPLDFTLCFLIAVGFFVVSWIFLSLTREPARIIEGLSLEQTSFWQTVKRILQSDRNFTSFLVSRLIAQFGMMAFAFYTVYAVQHHHISESQVGIMTSVLFMTQVIANPLFGWIADRFGHKWILEAGAIATILSVLMAWQAPGIGLFYVAIVLYGAANTIYWTIGMAMTLEFGEESQRPTYVGLANSLLAPATILAPILGGWLADSGGYPFTFVTAAGFAALTTIVLHFWVRDPKTRS